MYLILNAFMRLHKLHAFFFRWYMGFMLVILIVLCYTYWNLFFFLIIGWRRWQYYWNWRKQTIIGNNASSILYWWSYIIIIIILHNKIIIIFLFRFYHFIFDSYYVNKFYSIYYNHNYVFRYCLSDKIYII